MMIRSTGPLVAAIAALGVILAVSTARALPRYSARYGQDCTLCHVNPTGGGMRTTYASQYIVPKELAWTVPGDKVLDLIDPQISNSITLGADFRLLGLGSDVPANTIDFFQMQGDLYVCFQMTPKLQLYYDRGISESDELFGLGYYLPLGGYVKAGRFVPAYGWRFDDHTAFVRSGLGFTPPLHTDVGVEVGLLPGRSELQFSVLNGSPGSRLDTNNEVETALRVASRLDIGPLGLAAGVSGMHNPTNAGTVDAAGGFGYATLSRLTWVGEIDWRLDDPKGPGRTTSMVTSHEVSLLVHRGLDLVGTYDFRDPDWKLKTGAESRYGGGISLLASPFVSVEALARYYNITPGSALSGSDYTEAFIQLHLLY